MLNIFCKKKLISDDIRVPTRQINSDVYIVEFPKSGITWLSTIVANINLIESNSKQRATYYNIQQLIPDIHMNRNISDQPIWDTPKYRFIKSHFEFCPYYNQVIYLVRNPLDVMNSYFYYLSMLNIFKGTYEEFVTSSDYGISNWIKHVYSWLFRGDSSQRIHVIKYEELKENSFFTIQELYLNLGLKIDEKSINEALYLGHFKNMKDSENLYKRHNPNTSLVFVREGNIGNNIADKGVEEYILSETKHIREKLDY